MIKNSLRQTGSAHVVIIIIVVTALLGILGYVAWSNFITPKNEVVNVDETENNPQVEVEYRSIKINGLSFRYPINENNEKVIIISGDSTLNISYVPIRNYYANKDVNDDCKNYVAGLVNVNTEKEIMDNLYLSRFYGKNSLEDALADETLIQVGDKDLYLGGPSKQNEPCVDIYENKDQELQYILTEVKSIRSEWLKSLELVK